MTINFKQITIIGVGLIGGSFARACRNKGVVEKIIGYGRGEKNLRRGVELGVIDDYSLNLEKAVEGADLIFLATPVEAILSTARDMSAFLKPGVIVTDGGSVKGGICEQIKNFLPQTVNFVGAHPIAGTEKGGVDASSDTLFDGAKCIITPDEDTSLEALKTVTALWTILGCHVFDMKAEEHDLIMGGVSHLPHVVAYALMNVIAKLSNENRDVIQFSAGGLKDITRIASSSPGLWREICIMNKEKLIKLIRDFKASIEEVENFINNKEYDNLEKLFCSAKEFRDKIK